jgi:alpha-galactosidase
MENQIRAEQRSAPQIIAVPSRQSNGALLTLCDFNGVTTARKSPYLSDTMKYLNKILFVLAAFACIQADAQKFPDLALTPQMGWNSWNKFQGRVSEELIRQTADAMVTNGMKDAGYQYVNIDDLWQGERDTNGNITADARRFPSGIKALADYVHSKGLKLGIYSDAGTKTCGGRPGSENHELQDAKSYAAWGVDYLKYDWCSVQGLKAPEAYKKMSDALYAAGRPILFSLCEWGGSKPWTWAKDVGASWRTTGDITACFDCIKEHPTYKDYGVLAILDMQVDLRKFAGPGHWNDPDMLEVGNGMTINEDRAHFTLWCMLAAPLISGNDLRHMNPQTLAILTDKDVIALNQDALGVQALKYSAKDGVEVWFKPLSDGGWGMCILNRTTTPQKFTFDWKNEKLVDDVSNRDAKFDTTTYSLRDLWAKKDAGTTKDAFTAEIPGHDVLTLRLTKM